MGWQGTYPTLAITSGDPCGIGPEVIVAAMSSRPVRGARLVIIGDLPVFARAARQRRLKLPAWTVAHADTPRLPDASLVFLDCAHRNRFIPRRTSRYAGAASLRYLNTAIRLCRTGQAQGIVTGPVTKWAIESSGHRFTGHTEYLARAFRASWVVMMFASARLRVVLLSRHVPLGAVAKTVTRASLRRTLEMTHRELRSQFGIRHPRVAVCGLNPHAGEAGLFGTEEQDVLRPVLRQARRRGWRVDGPFAADGFFAARPAYDVVLCWYHDQGLIPFKLMARDCGCQVTLGLPIVRTSPDHGSALEIAGTGRAHPGSMRYALALAAQLARARHAHEARTA